MHRQKERVLSIFLPLQSCVLWSSWGTDRSAAREAFLPKECFSIWNTIGRAKSRRQQRYNLGIRIAIRHLSRRSAAANISRFEKGKTSAFSLLYINNFIFHKYKASENIYGKLWTTFWYRSGLKQFKISSSSWIIPKDHQDSTFH